jgi:Transposase
MAMSCGIDWSEAHHDVAVVAADGRLVVKRRIGDDAAGFQQLLELLAEAGDSPEAPVPVAIETTRGCWWRACAPPAGRCMRSIRWQQPATGSGMRSRARNPTTPMPWYWPTSCVPTEQCTGRCRPTPNWSARSPCWPVPNKTRSGIAPRPTTSYGRCCASTPQASWQHLVTCAVGSCGPSPRPAGGCPHPRRGGQADLAGAGRVVAPGRPPASPACPRCPPAPGLRRPLPAPAAAGRAGDGPTRPGPAGCAGHRLRQRRRAGHRDPAGVRVRSASTATTPASA